jgi:hypothetical protein
MPPIDLALFDARDRALAGREAAELNELCRQIVGLLRLPPDQSDRQRDRAAIGFVALAEHS